MARGRWPHRSSYVGPGPASATDLGSGLASTRDAPVAQSCICRRPCRAAAPRSADGCMPNWSATRTGSDQGDVDGPGCMSCSQAEEHCDEAMLALGGVARLLDPVSRPRLKPAPAPTPSKTSSSSLSTSSVGEAQAVVTLVGDRCRLSMRQTRWLPTTMLMVSSTARAPKSGSHSTSGVVRVARSGQIGKILSVLIA